MNIAIILAGGIGRRMNLGYNKVFAELAGAPILAHTLTNFEECDRVDQVVVVAGNDSEGTAAEDIARVSDLIEERGFGKVISVVAGGATRMQSAEHGLAAADADDKDIVLVQDGDRPFTPPELITRAIEAAEQHDAAVCGAQPKDTIQLLDAEGLAVETLDRSRTLSVFTPVAARWGILQKAREKAQREGYIDTPGYEDSAVLQRYGVKVKVVPCDYTNIKITTPDDLEFAELIFEMLADRADEMQINPNLRILN